MAAERTNPLRLMLIGESNVGKSHYGGQLLMRLNQRTYALQMTAQPTNIDAFNDVTKALHEGKSAPHTSANTYIESLWPVVDDKGRAVDLEWPDYGGEQVRRLIDDRRIPVDWRERLLKADGWILMIRIQRSAVEDDVFSKPLAEAAASDPKATDAKASLQARMVELLQMLIYVRGVGTSRALRDPALLVLLSCWDELDEEGEKSTPIDVLKRRMPLLASFVESNWQKGRHEVLGLSALGRPLDAKRSDVEYVDSGPESFGYIIEQNGRRNPDLSIPISRLASIVSDG